MTGVHEQILSVTDLAMASLKCLIEVSTFSRRFGLGFSATLGEFEATRLSPGIESYCKEMV